MNLQITHKLFHYKNGWRSVCRTAARYGLAVVVLTVGNVAAEPPAGKEQEGVGTMTLSIRDAGTGRTLPARIRVRDSEGIDHLPAEAVVVSIAEDRWFCSDGSTTLEVPAGPLEIRVERGKEYRPVKQRIRMSEERQHESIELHRWIDMGERGYRSGDNHVHLGGEKLTAVLAAEDLDFGSSLLWWNGPRWGADHAEGTLSFGGESVVSSLMDAEVERAWGAVYLVGLAKPITLEPAEGRFNLPFLVQAQRSGGLVCYQGGWSPEVLVDLLLGSVDMVNICSNLFHRHKYLPRIIYSNLLEVPGFPTYANDPHEMMRLSTESYYRLLNCGFNLAAGAGSAAGVKSTPVGYNRAYVRVERDGTLDDFWRAWKRGENFVTNGPMLFLTVNEEHRPGKTLDLRAGGATVTVSAEAFSEQPLTALEIIVNGSVVGQKSPEGQGETRSAEISLQVDVREGSWIAARCVERDMLLSDDELAPYVRTRGRYSEAPTRLRFAHTSPVYVTVGGQGARVEHSLEEAARMLDAFELFVTKHADEDHQAEARDALARARAKLAGMMQRR